MSPLMKLLMSPSGLAFDRALVRWTGESLLNRVFARQAGFAPQPALLLQTRGRRSGTPRQAVMPWLRIDGKRVVVGSNQIRGNEFFHGKIDDLRIYSRALSSNEIQQIVSSEAAAPPWGL